MASLVPVISDLPLKISLTLAPVTNEEAEPADADDRSKPALCLLVISNSLPFLVNADSLLSTSSFASSSWLSYSTS